MSVHARRLARHAGALLTSAICLGAAFATPAQLPSIAVDTEANPYRAHADRTAIVEVGRGVYNQSCAACHGLDANRLGPAPALRTVGRFCQRITDASLRSRCVGDADHYFYKSVMEGKVKLGVTHMPAWRGVLPPEAVWAVRTFLESPPPSQPSP